MKLDVKLLKYGEVTFRDNSLVGPGVVAIHVVVELQLDGKVVLDVTQFKEPTALSEPPGPYSGT